MYATGTSDAQHVYLPGVRDNLHCGYRPGNVDIGRLFPRGVVVYRLLTLPGTNCPLPYGFWILVASDDVCEAPNRSIALQFNVGWNGNILVMMSTLDPEPRVIHVRRVDLRLVKLVVGM